MFKASTIFFALILLKNGVSAQSFQLAGISYAKHTKSERTDAATSGQYIEFQDMSVYLKLPKQFKNQKTILMPTLRYTQTQATLQNSPLFLEAKKQKNLHSITLSAMMLQKISKKWTLIGAVVPTLASDFDQKLQSEDLLVQGAGLAICRLSETWVLGGGAIYTTQLGAPRFLPAVQLKYHRNRHLFNMLLPSFARYLYQLDQPNKWHIGARVGTNGGNFNVASTDFSAVQPVNINRLYAARLNASAVLQIQLHKTLLLEAHGGISTGRNIRLEDVSGNLIKYNAATGGYFNLGLIMTVPTKDVDANNLDN